MSGLFVLAFACFRGRVLGFARFRSTPVIINKFERLKNGTVRALSLPDCLGALKKERVLGDYRDAYAP